MEVANLLYPQPQNELQIQNRSAESECLLCFEEKKKAGYEGFSNIKAF